MLMNRVDLGETRHLGFLFLGVNSGMNLFDEFLINSSNTHFQTWQSPICDPVIHKRTSRLVSSGLHQSLASLILTGSGSDIRLFNFALSAVQFRKIEETAEYVEQWKINYRISAS